MDFTIRPVRESDAAAMSELLNAIIQTGKYTILEGPISPEMQLEFIRGFPARGAFFVAERAGRMLGFQDVSPASSWSNAMRHVAEISTFIAMDAQGQGVGGQLSQVTFAAAKENSFEKITAMIRGDNPRAVGFYLAQGFKPVGTLRRHAFVNGRYIDEILAEKMLE